MDCPACGGSFDSEQGMRINHGHAHDEKSSNWNCKGCGTEFYDPKSRLKYCEDCKPNAERTTEIGKGRRSDGVSNLRGGIRVLSVG